MESDTNRDMSAADGSLHPAFERFITVAQARQSLKTAIVHPCDTISIESVATAVRLGLIDPILVGPEARIRAAADLASVDISPWPLIDTPHSHASAEAAVALVRAGQVAALMKGSLHTDELLTPVVDRTLGLRTERRISHCFVFATKGHDDPFIVTDAAINIAPSLHEKADIVQNAIDLAHVLNFPAVRVAILSATEMVDPAIASTIEAAALCKMADRGQISGALIDGPLALDNAINMGAVAQKHIVSEVAGRANVLVVPDLEAGNILAKTLSFIAHAEATGIVIGARVPIILTSRADTLASRIVSCAIAVLLSDIRIFKGTVKG